MPKTPIILIEGNEEEQAWSGVGHCWRQPEHDNTRSIVCFKRESCELPQIIARAATQREAREVMSRAKFPNCKEGKPFQFQDQPPQHQHEDTMPTTFEIDYVITP